MYICKECGHVFEFSATAQERHNELEFGGVCETVDAGCPVCGDCYYIEAKQCKDCGEWFDPDEILDGLCIECLLDRVTYDNFEKYCTEEEKYEDVPGTMEEFMFVCVFGLEYPDLPKASSASLKETIYGKYKLLAMEDKAIMKTGFLDKIKQFVRSDCPEEFAEFIRVEDRR